MSCRSLKSGIAGPRSVHTTILGRADAWVTMEWIWARETVEDFEAQLRQRRRDITRSARHVIYQDGNQLITAGRFDEEDAYVRDSANRPSEVRSGVRRGQANARKKSETEAAGRLRLLFPHTNENVCATAVGR
jgi:hypothetical protein